MSEYLPNGATRFFRLKALVPAAGMSLRMGAFKPLLPYGGATVIENAVGAVLAVADEAVVVLGKRADEVSAVLMKRFGTRVRIVLNPDYASTDMLRSVQLGLAAIGECDGLFLLPGDMPAVSVGTLKALRDAFDGSADVLYPVMDGRRGHPPLISARLIPGILAYEGDGGLRAVLKGSVTKELNVSDKGALTDLDTRQDYESAASGLIQSNG